MRIKTNNREFTSTRAMIKSNAYMYFSCIVHIIGIFLTISMFIFLAKVLLKLWN